MAIEEFQGICCIMLAIIVIYTCRDQQSGRSSMRTRRPYLDSEVTRRGGEIYS